MSKDKKQSSEVLIRIDATQSTVEEHGPCPGVGWLDNCALSEENRPAWEAKYGFRYTQATNRWVYHVQSYVDAVLKKANEEAECRRKKRER